MSSPGVNISPQEFSNLHSEGLHAYAARAGPSHIGTPRAGTVHRGPPVSWGAPLYTVFSLAVSRPHGQVLLSSLIRLSPALCHHIFSFDFCVCLSYAGSCPHPPTCAHTPSNLLHVVCILSPIFSARVGSLPTKFFTMMLLLYQTIDTID